MNIVNGAIHLTLHIRVFPVVFILSTHDYKSTIAELVAVNSNYELLAQLDTADTVQRAPRTYESMRRTSSHPHHSDLSPASQRKQTALTPASHAENETTNTAVPYHFLHRKARDTTAVCFLNVAETKFGQDSTNIVQNKATQTSSRRSVRHDVMRVS